jgi:hypothetical protein
LVHSVPLNEKSAVATTSSGARKIDGRHLRSERTRLAIIEAYLVLRRSPVMPTAAQIAEQAGCLTRSIFERFSDLDALSLATADHAIIQSQAEVVARHGRAPGGGVVGRSKAASERAV